MDKHDYDPVLDSPYDCEHCRDTGKLEGSDCYDCAHCTVAQERVALEQRAMPVLRTGDFADVLYREVRTAKRTAYAVAAAEMVLLRDKQMQAERRAKELERELAELRAAPPVVELSDDDLYNFWLYRDCMDAIRAGDMRAQFISAARAILAAAKEQA